MLPNHCWWLGVLLLLFAIVPGLPASAWHASLKDTSSIVALKAELDKVQATVYRGDTTGETMAKKIIEQAQQLGDPMLESKARTLGGLLLRNKGKVGQAREWFLMAVEQRKQINDKGGLASVYNNLGILEFEQGNNNKAAEYAKEAIKLRTEIDDKQGLAASFSNIGNLYEAQGLLQRALESHLKAAAISNDIKDTMGLAGAYTNIGNQYASINDLENCRKYYLKALDLYKAKGDEQGMSMAMGNLSHLMREMKNWQAGLDYALQALALKRKVKDQAGTIHTLLAVAQLFHEKGNYQVSSVYTKEAVELANKLQNAQLRLMATKSLAQQLALEGNMAEAYHVQEQYIRLNDSIRTAANMTQLAALEDQYQLQVQDNEVLRLTAEKAEAEAELLERNQEQSRNHILLLILALTVKALGVGAYFIYRSRRKVEALNLRLGDRTRELELQHQLLQEKNKAITDSISYAKQLQTYLERNAATGCTFGLELGLVNRPRDIVGGDFCWSFQDEDGMVLVVADCVGHGVRGAMLTMYGHVLLNELVANTASLQPSKLLHELDKRLVSQFEPTQGLSGGQMEVAVFLYYKNDEKLVCAGSRLPVYAITANGVETIRTGTIAVGNPLVKFKEYQDIELPLRDDVVYVICSDGLADQFGAESGKKFTRRRLRALMLESVAATSTSTLQHVAEQMIQGIIKWQGNADQTDDIILSLVGKDGALHQLKEHLAPKLEAGMLAQIDE